MNFPDALQKGALSLACASALWFGGTVVSGAKDNTRQDQEISQLKQQQQALAAATEKLNETVTRLDKNVAVLSERLRK